MNKRLYLAVGVIALASAANFAAAQSCAVPFNGGYGGTGSSKPYFHGQATYHDSFHYNLIWPNQYIQPSRRGICQAYATMVNNGWRRNNLMGSYHFESSEKQELSEAGRRKAQWILTQAPPNRRTIFIERAADDVRTAERVQALQDYAANSVPNSAPADVQESHLRLEGHSAGAVDAVFTGFSQNQLPPVLPESGEGGSSGSDSGN